jgi:sterol desaturase/sphingolipid hydroxylase (fatty acid hydroxylase superfamily)
MDAGTGSMSLGQFLKKGFSFREMQWLLVLVALLAAAAAMRAPRTWVLARGLVLGVLVWVTTEYFFHRFLLHMPEPRWAPLRKLHGRVHWQHHKTPADLPWLFVPAWGTPQLIAIAFGIGYLLGGVDLGLVAALGDAIVLVHYELTHLAAHVPYRPKTRFGAFMKRHHLLHHFKNERYWFGVTNPMFDLLLGTWPEPGAVPKSETARTLGIDDPETSATR